jgi:hypothetical protein
MTLGFGQKICGVWNGRGAGCFPPTVPEFQYTEELTIQPTGKPSVFEFRSSTKHADSGKPMHVECGFIRFPANGNVELIASHPFGLSEMSHGTFKEESSLMELRSDQTVGSISRAPSATSPHTTGIRRVYQLSADGRNMSFTMDMATDLHPDMQNHLICELEKRE